MQTVAESPRDTKRETLIGTLGAETTSDGLESIDLRRSIGRPAVGDDLRGPVVLGGPKSCGG